MADPIISVSPRHPTLLLRSSWQTANIGDIAHTPGMLSALERWWPEAQVILWPGKLDRGVEEMLRKRFPRLRLVRDAEQWRPASPRADDPTLAQAFAEADLLLHGSGPMLVAAADVVRWRTATNKPWGAIGITLGNNMGAITPATDFPADLCALLSSAAFVFTRETCSQIAALAAGVKTTVGFAPDATFSIDVRNEAAADALLAQHGLEPDRFICAVPRLRITPYWTMHSSHEYSDEEVRAKSAFNAQHVATDHAKLRAAIVAWVRATGMRVLVCPEMTYQTELFHPHVLDPLPADVKPFVSCLDRYWLTDEAASVYARARTVVSLECHSPIIANAMGRPALYLHQPQDTWKGQMYPDLGLSEWMLPIEQTTGEVVAERLLAIHRDYAAALARVRETQQRSQSVLSAAIRKAHETIGSAK